MTGIVEARIRGEGRPDRSVGRKFDDPAMVVTKLELARRAHHSAAFDAADRSDLQGDVAARNVGAGRSKHAHHAGAGIRSSANDLDFLTAAGIDGEDLELVRLRMLLRGENLGDAERGQRLRRIGDALDFQSDRRQLVGDFSRGAIGLEMLLEPAQAELHAPTPPEIVGTSSALKP